VQFGLANQVGRPQEAVWDRPRWWEGSHGTVLVFILKIRAVKAMTRTFLVHPAKEHLRRPIPGHLGKFIDGGDEQRWQTTVNLLVHDQDRQAFGRVPAAESTATERIAAVNKGAATTLGEGLDLDNDVCLVGV